MELEPKNICHADLTANNIILSPKMEKELPQVRIVHLEGVAMWNEQAVVQQIIDLLQHLTNGESHIPDEFRTNKKGDKLKDSIGRSLKDGDRLYSFVAGYEPEGELSLKDLKRRWRTLADRLAKELYDKGLVTTLAGISIATCNEQPKACSVHHEEMGCSKGFMPSDAWSWSRA